MKKTAPQLNKILASSPNKRQEILDEIKKLYPTLIQEDGALNEKELKALSDGYEKTESERYEFKWAGKTASKRFAFTPSKARLVPDEKRSVEFAKTQNLIIEGENLEVLKLLQSSYFKKVKMIYIDPPYNTGHDFVYSDDYSESKQAYWEQNGVFHDGVRMDTNSESAGRYHSNWLSMMQSRLLLARNLLRDDGVIFVSIDDNEVHNLRKLMDEIFGEENFVACITVVGNPRGRDYGGVARMHDYIMVYQKSENAAINNLREENKIFPYADAIGGFEIRELRNRNIAFNSKNRPNLYYPFYINTVNKDDNGFFEISLEKKKDWQELYPKESQGFHTVWRWGKERSKNNLNINIVAKEMLDGGYQIIEKYRESTTMARSVWHDKVVNTEKGTLEIKNLLQGKYFPFPKSKEMLMRIIEMGTDTEALILDFFAGSGTTAHAVMELNKQDGGNRKFILVQLPEETDKKSEAHKAGYKTISDITIERVKRAGKKIKAENKEVDVGFKVFKLAKSLFPQNLFEVGSEMSEAEKIKSWEKYLEKSKQAHLFAYKPDELLVEIALKDGFDLNFTAEPIKEFKKNKILDLKDGEKQALICLDETIHEDTVKALAAYKDQRLICLERAVDTTSKWNLRRMFGENLWVA